MATKNKNIKLILVFLFISSQLANSSRVGFGGGNGSVSTRFSGTKKVAESAPTGSRKIVATPYAKKLAKQHKVDINSVVGSGPFGRITPDDVEKEAGIAPSRNAVPSSAPATPAAAAATRKPAAAVVAPLLPDSTVVPFTTMQAAVSKNMVESLSVPPFRDNEKGSSPTAAAFSGSRRVPSDPNPFHHHASQP